MPLTKQECDGWEGGEERNKSEDLPILLIRTKNALEAKRSDRHIGK